MSKILQFHTVGPLGEAARAWPDLADLVDHEPDADHLRILPVRKMSNEMGSHRHR
jgi:hypothetical protein